LTFPVQQQASFKNIFGHRVASSRTVWNTAKYFDLLGTTARQLQGQYGTPPGILTFSVQQQQSPFQAVRDTA
jgi:hypothetical protein